MSLIDTHAHLDGLAARGELAGVLARARTAGVDRVITIGTEPGDWVEVAALARAHPGAIDFTLGLHPVAVGADWEAALAKLEARWAEANFGAPGGVVALGECGLDRFHLPKEAAEAEVIFDRQRRAFAAQLALARGAGCPIVVHSRGAFAETVAMIDASGVDWTKVVFHCFSAGAPEMEELTRRGGRGSFTGILTYKKAESVRAAALAQGVERLMLETDAPYLAPTPHRGKPNEPAFLRHTADYAATLFGLSYEDLARISTRNAQAFFNLQT